MARIPGASPALAPKRCGPQDSRGGSGGEYDRPVTTLPQTGDPSLRLCWRDGRVALEHTSAVGRPPEAISVDFLRGATARRAVGISRRVHPLARAVGRDAPLPRILDGTAGLGRDAFVLACLGYSVLAIERSEVLHCLLEDGLARLLRDPHGATLVGERLRVRLADSRSVLLEDPRPEVVYLDPMFPPRRKRARVKLELELCQRLLGPTDDAAELVHAARRAATRRVVVKRPAWGEPLASDVSFQVRAEKVRWDVYLTADSGG